jgi:hypothetical protein
MFPAESGGWEKREPARGIDPLDVREVPLRLGFATGINAVVANGGDSDSLLQEAA